MDLLHKTAVITGGGTGIGRSVAKFLAAGGARVVLCGRREEILEDAKRDIESTGGTACSTTINVTDSESVRDAFEIIDADYGGTDILVNGAGVLHSGNIVDFSEQDWDATVEVNLKGVFLCSKYALPQILSRDSGVIINISSALARAPYPGLAAYSASKAGVVAFTKALGGEIDGTRVKIWAVCPAATNTPMLQRVVGAEEARSAMKPERVAKICLDLIVGKHDLASGEAVFVDTEPVSHRVKRRIRKIVAEFS